MKSFELSTFHVHCSFVPCIFLLPGTYANRGGTEVKGGRRKGELARKKELMLVQYVRKRKGIRKGYGEEGMGEVNKEVG